MADKFYELDGQKDGNYALSVDKDGQELIHARVGLPNYLSYVDVHNLDSCHLLQN